MSSHSSEVRQPVSARSQTRRTSSFSTHQPITRQLLTPEDVARRCGLSRRAVYDAIRRGELPAMRLCSRLRVEPDAFEAWLAGAAVTPERSQRLCADPSPLPPAGGSFRALLNGSGEGAA